MPRTGGVYSPPAGTKGVPNTTIQSVPYNTFIDDLTADANAARPVTAGGTGATTASGARSNLGTDNAENLTFGTVNDARLPSTQTGKTFTSQVLLNDRLKFLSNAPIIEMGEIDASKTWFVVVDASTWSVREDGLGTVRFQIVAGGEAFINGNRVWHAGNDGAGSGSDADLLDSQHGSYYADIPARLGYTPLNSATYTASDILTKIKTVDGTGSGLDADTCRGADPNDSGFASTLAKRRSDGSLRAQYFMTDSGINSGTVHFGTDGNHALSYTGSIWNAANGDFSLTAGYSFKITSGASYQYDGNIVFADGMTAYGSTLSAALNVRAVVYTGSTVNETTFPIGHTIVAAGNIDRNTATNVWLTSGNNQDYTTTSAVGAILAGVWRGRGRPAVGATNLQRTA